jgi:hypothetical protein
MLELQPQSDHPSDGVLGEDRTDDALSLEDIRWPEDSPPNPTLVSAYGTDASPEVFEDLLNPALFESEAPTSQSISFEPSQDINMRPSDSEDEVDLPNLDSLLSRNPIHVNPKHPETPAHEKLARSTRQIQGWVEIQDPDGASVLQELPDYGPETQVEWNGMTAG